MVVWPSTDDSLSGRVACSKGFLDMEQFSSSLLEGRSRELLRLLRRLLLDRFVLFPDFDLKPSSAIRIAVLGSNKSFTSRFNCRLSLRTALLISVNDYCYANAFVI